MTLSVSLIGTSNGGWIELSAAQKRMLRDFCREHAGEQVQLKLLRPKRSRSLSQNAYYWAILDLISAETGHTPEELHEAFKWRFLRRSFDRHGLELPKSTATMSTAEFAEYLDRINAFASTELNMSLPQPHQA